ncbi:type VI secretion protein [Streptomyces sp. NPDC021622]|uniref:type IV secretory system conjugative DNA transfer family protein n=1 Tax=Streptomyces sp. NPDC021622 TaxID=3155013 RepID=UPI0033CD3575
MSFAAVASGISVAGPRLDEYLRDPLGFMEACASYLHQLLRVWGPFALPALALVLTTMVVIHRWWRRRCRRALAAHAHVLRILPPPEVEPAGAAVLWSHLVGLLRPAWRRLLTGQPHLCWEYVFDHDCVRIQLWVPGGVPPGMVERAVQAAWPGTHTRTHTADSPLQTNGHPEAATGELRYARSEALPLREDFPTDPLRSLFGAATSLGPREHAVVQILARPVTGRRVRKTRREARHIRRSGSPARQVSRLLDAITPGFRTSARTRSRAADPVAALEVSAEDRAIAAKQRGASYETRIRYAVIATPPAHPASPEDRRRVRSRLRGHAHGLASTYAAYTEHNYFRRARSRHVLRDLAERRLNKGDLQSIGELSALAHLPWDAHLPGLQRAGARAVPPPPGIAVSGSSVRPIGLTDTGKPHPVGVYVADARQHVHLLGATGTGKSELLAHIILADAEAGRGQVVVDPKGDLVTDVLMRLPEHLGEKVVLLDADSRSRPPVLNPLEGKDAERAVDNLVSIFSRVYASSWGPRTDDILRAGLLTLRALPGTPTLVDLPKLLSVPAFRQRAVQQIHDDVLRGFWSWYDALSGPARAHVTAPLMNKLRGFLLRPFVRQALAGGPSTVHMDQVLDRGGICLVRIARDALGAETAHLVGSVVVARTWQGATRRAHIPQTQRRDASLYIDEAHHFLNLPYALGDMLAEARGYRLSVTLAHQYLRQLPRELEEGISTNARTKIFFNASPEDAHHLVRHTEPRITEHDLSHLDAFHAVVRPVLHGAQMPAFTAVTQQLPPPAPGRAKRIRAAARRNARPEAGPTPLPTPGSPTADPRRTN